MKQQPSRCLAGRSQLYINWVVTSRLVGGCTEHTCQMLIHACMQALEKISHEHPAACLRHGGLLASLSYLDFFQTGVQRVAVATAANMCRSITSENTDAVASAIPILTNLLQYQVSCLCLQMLAALGLSLNADYVPAVASKLSIAHGHGHGCMIQLLHTSHHLCVFVRVLSFIGISHLTIGGRCDTSLNSSVWSVMCMCCMNLQDVCLSFCKI